MYNGISRGLASTHDTANTGRYTGHERNEAALLVITQQKACHGKGQTYNHSVSSNSSPAGSFGASHWASCDGNVGDLASASSDSVSRTPDQLFSREGHLQSRASTFVAPFGCSRESTSSNARRSSFHRNHSGTYSLSKKGPRGFFRRQKSDSRMSFQNVALEGGVPWPQGSGQQAGGMDWSMQAFSQLVAFSQREGFGLSENPDGTNTTETADEGFSSSLERIRVSSLPSPRHHSPELRGDGQICGVCSRWLRHKSPWSSQGMLVGNRDMPVVGVLACGHVFHADCLEKDVPEMLRHDPPCPQCDRYQDASWKATSSAGGEVVKVGNISLKTRFPNFGPQLWRRSLSGSKLGASSQPDRVKEESGSREKGFFQRSLSRKQFPFLARAVKDSSSSRKVSSAAQVSPENQT
ncbi:hypothetical protein L7F22_001720 [Adiantum nelumboides]|nr:hypothetical protein [Adiantum nelumboides]